MARKQAEAGVSFWQRYCRATSLHGFNQVALSSSRCEALLWLSVIALCLVAALQQLSVLLKAYITPDDFWSSRIYEDTSSAHVPLPSITICNANYLRASQLRVYNVSDNVRDYILQRTQPMQAFPTPDANINHNASLYRKWRASMGNRTLAELLHLLGHTCEETVMSVWMKDVIALGSDEHEIWVRQLLQSVLLLEKCQGNVEKAQEQSRKATVLEKVWQ